MVEIVVVLEDWGQVLEQELDLAELRQPQAISWPPQEERAWRSPRLGSHRIITTKATPREVEEQQSNPRQREEPPDHLVELVAPLEHRCYPDRRPPRLAL